MTIILQYQENDTLKLYHDTVNDTVNKTITSTLVEKGIIIRRNGRRNGWWEILV